VALAGKSKEMFFCLHCERMYYQEMKKLLDFTVELKSKSKEKLFRQT